MIHLNTYVFIYFHTLSYILFLFSYFFEHFFDADVRSARWFLPGFHETCSSSSLGKKPQCHGCASAVPRSPRSPRTPRTPRRAPRRAPRSPPWSPVKDERNRRNVLRCHLSMLSCDFRAQSADEIYKCSTMHRSFPLLSSFEHKYVRSDGAEAMASPENGLQRHSCRQTPSLAVEICFDS